jgi:hypothetical protein
MYKNLPEHVLAAIKARLPKPSRPLTPEERAWLAEYDRRKRMDEAEAFAAETVPVYLVPPPSAAEERAADKADLARYRLEKGVLVRLRAGAATRCENCFTLHLRRELDADLDGSDGFEDLFISACCGRSSCPFCWRRRLLKSIQRAVGCLLEDAEPDQWAVIVEEAGRLGQCYIHDNPKAAHQARRQLAGEGKAARVEFLRGRRPHRLGLVHLAETTYPQWPALDRLMRRRQPHRTGCLRVRRGDDSVLVISAAPFPGSRPVTPAEAAERAAEAIEHLHTARSSFRMLGAWSDYAPSPWKLVGTLPKLLDAQIVEDEVRALGSAAKRLGGQLAGLVYRSDTLQEAQAIGRRIEKTLLKFMTVQQESKQGDSLPDPSLAPCPASSDTPDFLDSDLGDSPWT